MGYSLRHVNSRRAQQTVGTIKCEGFRLIYIACVILQAISLQFIAYEIRITFTNDVTYWRPISGNRAGAYDVTRDVSISGLAGIRHRRAYRSTAFRFSGQIIFGWVLA